ncbi:hypothetical protein OBBRIDRAFT_792375 [Obba rivulosa]|uniref:Uncharacterized protein n=1 Tax=Obba rivulosa TaxID=1052685 RepID=A0A8E2B334_9APHY|nr:hypothetical protein OBBRIDRAFT_792375 [Obba rivulosa]
MQDNDRTEQPPPAKRPRLSTGDGFAESKSTVKLSALNFVSAFGASSSTFKRPVQPPAKPTKRPDPPQPPVQDLNLPGPSRLQQKNPTFRELKPPPRPVVPSPEPSREKRTPQRRSTVKLDAAVGARSGVAEKHAIVVVNAPRFQPPTSPSRAKKEVTLRSLVPPPPLLPAKKEVTLRALVPPPPPGPSKLASGLKSIFDTPVAVATDPRTERGSAALLSLFLQQNGHEFLDATERELQRGLGQSPEKASKTKSAKHIRGGLAEDAKRLFSQKMTSLSLWQTQVEGYIRGSRRLTPELRVRIVSVLHDVEDVSNKTVQAPRTGIVRCRSSADSRAQDYVILLSFGSSANPPRLNKLEDLQTGRELYIWRPWQTMELPETLPVGILPSLSPETPLFSQRFPRFGLPESGQDCVVLFCSRFWIVPT